MDCGDHQNEIPEDLNQRANDPNEYNTGPQSPALNPQSINSQVGVSSRSNLVDNHYRNHQHLNINSTFGYFKRILRNNNLDNFCRVCTNNITDEEHVIWENESNPDENQRFHHFNPCST